MNVRLPLLRYSHEERGDSQVALAYKVRTEVLTDIAVLGRGD